MLALLKLHLIWISTVTCLNKPGVMFNQNIQAGIRANRSSCDLIETEIEYWRCADKCRRRPSCTAVSYHGKMHICYLSHEPGPVKVESKGFMFSRKSDWAQEYYTWCNDRCKAGQVCHYERETCETNECLWPENPNNGIILGNSRGNRENIAYLCDRGFVVHKRSSLKCKDGNWKGADPVCQLEIVQHSLSTSADEY